MNDPRGDLAGIRARRHELQAEEDVISFVRRMAQGRADLVQDETRRRASGTEPAIGSLSERLAEVFGQQHGGGSARPPRETNVPADHPLLRELDELCEHYDFASLDTLDDRALSDLGSALAMFEKDCSRRRHELFEQIDALTAELVARVRAGGTASLASEPPEKGA